MWTQPHPRRYVLAPPPPEFHSTPLAHLQRAIDDKLEDPACAPPRPPSAPALPRPRPPPLPRPKFGYGPSSTFSGSSPRLPPRQLSGPPLLLPHEAEQMELYALSLPSQDDLSVIVESQGLSLLNKHGGLSCAVPRSLGHYSQSPSRLDPTLGCACARGSKGLRPYALKSTSSGRPHA